jgi:hypothetical protein
MRRIALAGSLSMLAAGLMAGPGHAAVTLGQVGPPGVNCGSPTETLQPTVTSGASYVAPASGTITSWSTLVSAQDGPAKFKVYRPVAGTTDQFTVVGQDGPRTLTLASLNTFTLTPGIAVQRNDVIGIASPNDVIECGFAVPGETRRGSGSDAATGATITTGVAAGFRTNVSAVLDPANTFTLGAVKKNKKKGNATVTVSVPNPGSLAVSGKGVKAVTATVAAAGEVPVKIAATGKKKGALRERGKVKVSPTFAFTPTGGTATDLAAKVKLKKN